MSLTYCKLELLICSHFHLEAMGINRGCVTLMWASSPFKCHFSTLMWPHSTLKKILSDLKITERVHKHIECSDDLLLPVSSDGNCWKMNWTLSELWTLNSLLCSINQYSFVFSVWCNAMCSFLNHRCKWMIIWMCWWIVNPCKSYRNIQHGLQPSSHQPAQHPASFCWPDRSSATQCYSGSHEQTLTQNYGVTHFLQKTCILLEVAA